MEECDLAQVSKSTIEQRFDNKALVQEPFFLVIPPNQNCFQPGGLTYKFCLEAENGNKVTKACTEVISPEDMDINGVSIEVRKKLQNLDFVLQFAIDIPL